MATSAARELEQLVKRLSAERKQHVDAIADIDATFTEVGIEPVERPTRGGRKGRTKGAEKTSRAGKRTGKAVTGKAAGRKSASKAKRPGRKRMTADQWVLGQLKDGKPKTSGEINAAWKKSGRPGDANNSLSKLVKEGKLKRANIEGARGSQYSLA